MSPKKDISAASGDGDFKTAHVRVGKASTSDAEAEKILSLLASENPADLQKVYRELLPAWVKRSPESAAAFAQSPGAAKWRVDLMVVVAQTWTHQDVDAAEDWASQLPNPTERNMVLGYVTFAEADTNPTRAARILQNSELSSDRREILVENLAQLWAKDDLQPLYDQVNRLPVGSERDGLFKRIALAHSQNNPAEAAQIVAEKMAPGPAQSEAAVYVVREWARKDRPAATAWVNAFPAGAMQNRAREALSGELYGAFQP
ncbi:MAG TPA: hypothetical protein VNB29_00585 [Chthoniobacterales bacterium]|nr:hypothetical protein [Chthoniobacterales bacterium]